jgi:hypothetical protein
VTTEAREAEEAAARHVASMPETPGRDVIRLSYEVGYLRGTIATRNIELQIARERIAELEAAMRCRRAVRS